MYAILVFDPRLRKWIICRNRMIGPVRNWFSLNFWLNLKARSMEIIYYWRHHIASTEWFLRGPIRSFKNSRSDSVQKPWSSSLDFETTFLSTSPHNNCIASSVVELCSYIRGCTPRSLIWGNLIYKYYKNKYI